MKTENTAFVGLLFVAATTGAFVLEAFSTMPEYKTSPATIRKVVRDPAWGQSDWLTLGRFADGTPAQQRGDLGDPGETIMMLREDGTTSLFGIMGDRSIFNRE